MAELIINIPDDKLDYILEGLAIRFGYPPEVQNPEFNPYMVDNPDYDPEKPEDPETNPILIPGEGYNGVESVENPQSKKDFAKERIIEFIKFETAHGYRLKASREIEDQVAPIELI